MKLHYSQTLTLSKYDEIVFQYLMKLHYSQTKTASDKIDDLVSVPYEITLLSNALATISVSS